jgi:hypothetical protein
MVKEILGLALLASLPAFLFGTLEDLTKKVSVRTRLLATLLSGVIACLITGISIQSVHVPGVDYLLAWWPFSVIFTALAIAGFANASGDRTYNAITIATAGSPWQVRYDNAGTSGAYVNILAIHNSLMTGG